MVALAELGEISKAYEDAPKKRPEGGRAPKGYRRSYWDWANPRSETYVKEGAASAARRIGGNVAGGMLIGPIGTTAASWRNVSSGDTVSYHKKTGKRAKGKVSSGAVALNLY